MLGHTIHRSGSDSCGLSAAAADFLAASGEVVLRCLLPRLTPGSSEAACPMVSLGAKSGLASCCRVVRGAGTPATHATPCTARANERAASMPSDNSGQQSWQAQGREESYGRCCALAVTLNLTHSLCHSSSPEISEFRAQAILFNTGRPVCDPWSALCSPPQQPAMVGRKKKLASGNAVSTGSSLGPLATPS